MTQDMTKIEDALNSNKSIPCGLLGQRVFDREVEGNKELLALVYGDGGRPFVWGHIFKKEGLYITCFVGLQNWFNGKDSHEIFSRFWHHISYLGDWHPLNSPKDSEIYFENNTFQEALDALSLMIINFEVGPLFISDIDDIQTDYRILGVYPFPMEDAKIPSYPGWEHEKDIFDEEG